VRIRVASFNLLHGARADDHGTVDVAALQRSAASLDADLLALQEVDVGVPRSGRVDLAAAVAEAVGPSAVVVFGRAARVGGIGKYGNALVVRRGALADVTVLPLPRLGRRHEPRTATLASVTIGGGARFTVAATHLSIHRPEVHEQLAAVVRALVARPAPWLLVGDLNLGAAEVEPVVAAAGLALADPTEPSFPRDEPRARIDHVAVGGGLRAGAVSVVPTETSDHRALVVDVEVEVVSG
jgi:endonuclease/exonuclease/phosphatase family metal-dependent hydrolase